MTNPNPSPATRFKKGESGRSRVKANPVPILKDDDGTPKIREFIVEYLRSHPKELQKLAKFFVEDKGGRKTLWQMLEGKPREQAQNPEGVNLSVTIQEAKDRPCPACGAMEDWTNPEEPVTSQTTP